MLADFTSNELVVKISVSNMLQSAAFYSRILGFKLDERYTINAGGNYGNTSYMQMNFESNGRLLFVLGLYKDINTPYHPLPQTGTVPSFIVENIENTLRYLQSNQVVIDGTPGHYIITNRSDIGYEDKFFFFRDPDNNSLVMRQNINQLK
jgi:catechol 2,3-dioxygenase-like lactoylglutathione lyase family enzyme